MYSGFIELRIVEMKIHFHVYIFNRVTLITFENMYARIFPLSFFSF